MFDFHEKRKIRSWVYSKTMIVFLVIPIVFLSMSVVERYQKERDTKEKRVEHEAELLEVEARAAALEAKVKEAESDRGVETEIRSRYDVAKEGEQVVVIIDEDDSSPSESVEDLPEAPEERSFWDVLKFW